MFMKKDTTFHDIREKSVLQWLEAMGKHSDLEVRGGVRATTDYVDDLNNRIVQLEKRNALKDVYLKKLKEQMNC